MPKRILNILIAVLFLSQISGCKFGYSFNQGSVPVEANNFSVKYFTNKAPQADPKYSREISEALIDLLNSQTRLDFTEEDGDLRFEGYISSYRNAPIAVGSDESASQERLTMSIQMKYINTLDPAQNVETSLSRYQDYNATQDFNSVEDQLVTEIIEQLVQDIYDKSLGNW